MQVFSGPWGDLRVFADEVVPAPVSSIAAATARFGPRFRPALLRFPRLNWPEAPYAAVWPEGRDLPDLTSGSPSAPGDLDGVVLAEVHRHICFVCRADFQAVRAEVVIPVLGDNLAAHPLVSGCPACGSDFVRSRVQAFALLPLS